MDSRLLVTVCVTEYNVPSMVSSVLQSFIHVTVVAGEPVEVQVSVCAVALYSSLVILGGAV